MRLRIFVVFALVAGMTLLTPALQVGGAAVVAGGAGLQHGSARIASTSYSANCGPATSSNWAGNEACEARGTFRLVSSYFIIPRTSTSGLDYFWVGVGGAVYTSGQHMLVQAGIGLRYGSDPYAWWEVIGNNGYNDGPNTVCTGLHVGDEVFVQAMSNYESDNVNSFEIEDITDSSRCDFSRNEPGTPLSDSATAECIVEFPGGPPGSNFGSLEFDGCDPGTNSTNAGIGKFPHYYSNIKDGSCVNVSVGAIQSDGGAYDQYTDYYHTC